MLVDREALNRSVFTASADGSRLQSLPDRPPAHADVDCAVRSRRRRSSWPRRIPQGLEFRWKVQNFAQPIKIAEICKETFKRGGECQAHPARVRHLIQQVYRDKQFQSARRPSCAKPIPTASWSALFTGGQNNPGGYSTKEMDTLLTQGRAELNVDKRKAIYKRISEIVADEVPWIRIQPNPFIWASTSKVGGFYINSQSRPFVALREMTVQK